MIAINITLMSIVVVGIVSLLSWAILSSRQRSEVAGVLPASAAAHIPASAHRSAPQRQHAGRTHSVRARSQVRTSPAA
jgi:hypothetical protein